MSEPVRPATQNRQQPKDKYLCWNAGKNLVRVKIVEVESDESWSSDEENTGVTKDAIMPLGEVTPAGGDGLSHSGGPEAETEEQVDQLMGVGSSIGLVSDGEVKQASANEKGPRILRAPRAPTQRR